MAKSISDIDMNKKIILFDIDDTIYNNYNFYLFGYNAVFHHLEKLMKMDGYEIDFELMREKFEDVYLRDKNSTHIITNTLKELGVNNEDLYYYTAKGIVEFNVMKSMMKSLPGARSVLRMLLKRGYVLGLVSMGKDVKQWDKVIRIGLDDYFDRKYCFFTMNKNDDFFKEIAKKLKKDKFKENWYIGDKENEDILTAINAGFNTIRVYSYRQRFDFENTKADYKIEKLKELLKIIN